MAYAIKDSKSKTYFRCMTGIGPCYGGKISNAVIFRLKKDAEQVQASYHLGFIMSNLVRVSDRRLK